jgi:hypothetical protein
VDSSSPERQFSFRDAGWSDALPYPAVMAHTAISVLCQMYGDPVPGECLEEIGFQMAGEPGENWWDVEYDALAPRGDDEDWDFGVHEDDVLRQRRIDDEQASLDESRQRDHRQWTRLAAAAGALGMAMSTPRDTIEFMRHIGLIERIDQDDGDVAWRCVYPIPLAEEILDVREELRLLAARRRWDMDVYRIQEQILTWLWEGSSDAPYTTIQISMAEIARAIETQVDDVRYGLMGLVREGDVLVDPGAEAARPDRPLTITVDWEQLEKLGPER